jgi:hypothetical protein
LFIFIRYNREELEVDFDEEATTLVMDKDNCMSVVTSSHDNHVGKIQKKEDEARSLEMKRFQEQMSKYSNEESARNRNRVLQIHEFSKMSKNYLHLLLQSEDEEGYDEDDHLGGK